jgi:hypothetical protein
MPDRPDLPPASRVPENVPDYLRLLDIGGYHVGSWGPEPDGKGQSTQVHLTLRVPGGAVVMRLKSHRAVNTLIAALERHRDDVWPGGAD